MLRLRRPLVIVDEAHNARTELSFETLSRFDPSFILEFSATPDTERQPSDILYSVSAAETTPTPDRPSFPSTIMRLWGISIPKRSTSVLSIIK